MVSCSVKDIMKANITYKIIASPMHWYAWQLLYSHYVTDTSESFHFLDIDKNVPPILLWIEVALLNKYNQNIRINHLSTDIESWWTFVNLVENSALKKTILTRIWRSIAFLCHRGIFFRIYGLLRYHCQYEYIFFGYYLFFKPFTF